MDFCAALVNSVGLGLDIVGVVLLFFFGLPSKAGLDGILTWRHGDSKDLKRARVFSSLALALLVIGFPLQIASNWI